MKCPSCGDEIFDTVTSKLEPGNVRIKNWCHQCRRGFNERLLIDPAELLRLIEKVSKKQPASLLYNEWLWVKTGLEIVGDYLTGDTDSLRRLAGEDK